MMSLEERVETYCLGKCVFRMLIMGFQNALTQLSNCP